MFERAVAIWEKGRAATSARPWSQRLAKGDLGLAHYRGFLMETYHNAGLNPQLQGYASLAIKGRPRGVVRKFFQHAIAEIGHDVLAMNDLAVLGVSNEQVIHSRPLAETKAFFANTVYNIQTLGVPAYLAYLFYLEYTPTQTGPGIMEMLRAKGIPENALTFLEEHSTVDISHLKLMRTYMEELVATPADEAIFNECLEDCLVLHTHMLEAAFANGETHLSVVPLAANA